MGKSVSKSSCKTSALDSYWLDKDSVLPKKVQELRLCTPLRLSGIDSMVAQRLQCQEGLTTFPV